jgi:epoxyqueuosine reductase
MDWMGNHFENRAPDGVPDALEPDLENWIFGCDICQEVCPWNKFAEPTTEPRYQPRDGTTDTLLDEWADLDLEAFRERFAGSAVTQARHESFLHNVRIARRNARARENGSSN